MERESRAKRLSYTAMLRVIGAYLDDRCVYRVSVAEREAGVVLSFDPAEPSEGVAAVHLSYEDLVSRNAKARRHRRRRVESQDRSSGFEDYFRALGHELDELAAHDVLLDHTESTTLVSYSYNPPDAPQIQQERDVAVKPREQHDLLQEAIARRTSAAGRSLATARA